ncbi:hypothetical protein ACFFGT_04165 [Mucilaginibacter angelicae]|uniref:OmpA-like domain-containing protein n=1 Tax=Mucilaginibacter angelicae TaxID=869718 RepID=A0ABV6L0X4_9SPHI
MGQFAEDNLKLIDWLLLCVILIVLILTGFMLKNNLDTQNAAYDKVITAAMRHSAKDDKYFNESNTAIFAFSRSKDFAHTKAASTFLGFLLVFTGALYLLKVFKLSYKLKADQTPVDNVSLESTSPGLVMITLGVGIIIAVLVTKNELDYTVESGDTKAKLEQLINLLTILQDSTANQQTGNENGNQKQQTSKPPGKGKQNMAAVQQSTAKPDANFIPLTQASDLNSPRNKILIAAILKRLNDNPSSRVILTGSSNEGMVARRQLREKDFAMALRVVLIGMGASPGRIVVKSYGETGPQTDNQVQNGVKIDFKQD